MESTSAATRVFTIPELLELILTKVALREAERPKGLYRKPTTRLFVIQRVSRNFQAVITGSPSLRRLMYLAPPSDEDPWTSHLAVAWLLHTCGWEVSESPRRDGLLVMKANIKTSKRAEKHYDLKQMLRCHATWRKMRVPPVIIECLVLGAHYSKDAYEVRIEKESTLGQVLSAFPMQL